MALTVCDCNLEEPHMPFNHASSREINKERSGSPTSSLDDLSGPCSPPSSPPNEIDEINEEYLSSVSSSQISPRVTEGFIALIHEYLNEGSISLKTFFQKVC